MRRFARRGGRERGGGVVRDIFSHMHAGPSEIRDRGYRVVAGGAAVLCTGMSVVFAGRPNARIVYTNKYGVS